MDDDDIQYPKNVLIWWDGKNGPENIFAMPVNIWWGRTQEYPEWQWLCKVRVIEARRTKQELDIPLSKISTWDDSKANAPAV